MATFSMAFLKPVGLFFAYSDILAAVELALNRIKVNEGFGEFVVFNVAAV